MVYAHSFSDKILSWHNRQKKTNLPWQLNKTIYTVWLSEIMLQQTQVNTVIPYYNRFITKFPTLIKLATAELDEVLFMWSGLGYYVRAKNLHQTAKIILDQYQGNFPTNFDILISLPGIGKSTAGAILSLALNQHYPILDGNIKRILIRYYTLNYQITKISSTENKKLWDLMEQLIPSKKSKMIAFFNQAMMDLGRLICTSNTHPTCNLCPIKDNCQAFIAQTVNKYPIKKSKITLSTKTIWLLLLVYNNEMIWLERRKHQKIWNELFCFPEFSNFNTLNIWLFNHNLHHYKYEKMITLKHKLSHINLQIEPVLFNIGKKFCYNNENGIWYYLTQPVTIGLPKPIATILSKLRLKYNVQK